MVRLACVGLLISACGGDPTGPAADAAAPDAPRADAAAADAAACPASATSTVVIDTRALGFAALGNVDVGGESSCGGPHEGAAIVLSLDAERSDWAQTASFMLALPVTTGPRPITVYAGSGHAQWSATLDVTQVIVDGAGPDLSLVEGTLTGAASGTFTATHCASLDVTCI